MEWRPGVAPITRRTAPTAPEVPFQALGKLKASGRPSCRYPLLTLPEARDWSIMGQLDETDATDMKSFSAHEAKARFGALLDAALREPVTIEKHGRPVAVLLSTEDYQELETIKLERLRAEIQAGIDDIERGEVTEYDEAGLRALAEEIIAGGETATNR